MSGTDDERRLGGAILALLAGDDPLSARLQDARAIRERLVAEGEPRPLPPEEAFERALRRLAGRGLVDLVHDPYLPPRYLITRRGRDRAIRHRGARFANKPVPPPAAAC